MTSTDERLDDLARRVDRGFDRVDSDIRELRGAVGALQAQMNRFGFSMIGIFIAGFAGLFIRGF